MIGDIRGKGLMIGLEFDDAEKTPDSSYTQDLQRRLIANGLLLPTAGPDGNVLRIIPSLTVTEQELDASLDILATSLSQV